MLGTLHEHLHNIPLPQGWKFVTTMFHRPTLETTAIFWNKEKDMFLFVDAWQNDIQDRIEYMNRTRGQ